MDANYFVNADTGAPMIVSCAKRGEALADGHREISRDEHEMLVYQFRRDQEQLLADGDDNG